MDELRWIWQSMIAAAALGAQSLVEALCPPARKCPPLTTYEADSSRFQVPPQGPGCLAALPPYNGPAAPGEPLGAEAAQARLREIVEDLIRRPLDDQGRPRRVVVKAPPGLGKTAIAAAATREHRVIWFSPTHRQARETVAAFGGRARHALGREAVDPEGDGTQTMCRRTEELAALKRHGLARHASKLLCFDPSQPEGGQCPFWGQCGWTRQLLETHPISVCDHSYLSLPEAKALKDRAFTLAVVDEDPLGRLVHRQHWPLDALVAEGGTLGRIAADLAQGRTMRQIAEGLDREAAIADLRARLEALPGAGKDLPGVYPGAPTKDNLAVLERFTPDPRARLAGAYVAALKALEEGAVNALWHVPGDGDKRPHHLHTAWLARPATVEALPLLHLDATADPQISRALWGEGVEFYDLAVETGGVEVIQITDASLYKKKLEDPKSGLQDRVAALVQAGGPGTGLISHKGVVEALRESGRISEDTPTGHFNALRGLNALADCQTLVLAGRLEPPAQAVEETARALWPGADLDLGHKDYIPTRGVYRMRDGSTVPTAKPVRAHPDPRVNAVLAQKRDAELAQAAGRLRMVWGRPGRRLFVLTNVPVPGLVVDRLTPLDALVPDARACRGLHLQGGTLPTAAADLHRLDPQEWPTERAAKLWAGRLRKGSQFRENTFFPESETLFPLVAYRLEGQRGSDRTALTWHADPAVIRQALEDFHGRPVVRLALPDQPGVVQEAGVGAREESLPCMFEGSVEVAEAAVVPPDSDTAADLLSAVGEALEDLRERAAIAEVDGGLSREAAIEAVVVQIDARVADIHRRLTAQGLVVPQDLAGTLRQALAGPDAGVSLGWCSADAEAVQTCRGRVLRE